MCKLIFNISQVIMSSSHTILIKYDEEGYLSQFVSEMLYAWQKLTTRLENFKGLVREDLSFASVKIDINYWWTLPWWKILCHRWSHDQPQPERQR